MSHPHPWKIKSGDGGVRYFVDANGDTVVSTDEVMERILRAANAHDALVAACQKAIAALVMPSLNLQDEAIAMLAEALEPAALAAAKEQVPR